jgi:hypothetical protein
MPSGTAIDGLTRPRWRLPAGALILLSLLEGLLASPAARAHEEQEQRDMVLELGPEGIQLLLEYVLPPSQRAVEVRALVDADHSGAVDRPQEELARATLLGPRFTEGLVLSVDGVPVDLTLQDMAWQEGPGDPGPRRGFTGMALYAAALPLARDGDAAVRLTVAEGAIAASVEVQLDPGMEAVDLALPRFPDQPIYGPVELLPDLPLDVQVRRSAGEGSGSGWGTGSGS